MFDLQKFLNSPDLVRQMWQRNRDVATDVLPMSSRVAQARARYAGMSDAQLRQTIHHHPRAADALDALLTDIQEAPDAGK